MKMLPIAWVKFEDKMDHALIRVFPRALVVTKLVLLCPVTSCYSAFREVDGDVCVPGNSMLHLLLSLSHNEHFKLSWNLDMTVA